MNDGKTIFASLIDGRNISSLSTFYDKTKSKDFYLSYFVESAKKEYQMINPFVNRMFIEQFDNLDKKILDKKHSPVERTIYPMQ